MTRQTSRRILTAVACAVLAATILVPSAGAASHPTTSHTVALNHANRLTQPGLSSPDSANMYAPGDLLPHTGTIMPYLNAYLIFWLPPGYCYEPGCNNARYESLIMRYFRDVSNTPFYNIVRQYGVNPTVTTAAAILDTQAYPKPGTTAYPLQESDIGYETKRVMHAMGWSGGSTNAYFVFTAWGVQSCRSTVCSFPTYSGGFACGYHDSFAPSPLDGIGSSPIVFVNVWNTPLCANIIPHSPNGDPAADMAISTSSHEQFEAVTDPLYNGWYGASTGDEIGDKCHTSYPGFYPDGSNVILNYGDHYIVQAEWSNAVHQCALF